MRNKKSDLIKRLTERTEMANEFLSGSMEEALEISRQNESFEEKKNETIRKTFAELPILKDIMGKFKVDNFYIYIFEVPYFDYAAKKEIHICVQDKLAGTMQQDNIATNFHKEPGNWYFDLVIPYDIKWKSFTDALEESKIQIERAYLDAPHQLNALVRCTPRYNINKAFDLEENFVVWRINTEAPPFTEEITEAHYSYAWNNLSLPKLFPIIGTSQGERAEVGKMIVYEAEKETAEVGLNRIGKLFGKDIDIVKETISMNWNTITELGLAPLIQPNDVNTICNADVAKTTMMRNVAEIIEPVTVGDKKVSEKEMLKKFVERIDGILGEPQGSSVLYNLSDKATERDQEKYKILGSTLKEKVN
jgi:hypothetical protein